MNVMGKRVAAVLLTTLVVTLLAACGEPTYVSKSFYIYNDTDVAMTSFTLDVEGKGLSEPIQLLDSQLAVGGIQEVTVSLPEKQVKRADWIASAVTERGEEHSRPFEFGGLVSDGVDRVKGFHVTWYESGYYGAGVMGQSLEEFTAEADWWGDYECENVASLGIVNYEGDTFWFMFTATDGTEYGNTALADGFTAEYEDLVFRLSPDSKTVIVELGMEGAEDRPYAIYCGEYSER